MSQQHGIDDPVTAYRESDLKGSVERLNLSVEHHHLPRAAVHLARHHTNLRGFEEIVDEASPANQAIEFDRGERIS
jgi:hypothetical protein